MKWRITPTLFSAKLLSFMPSMLRIEWMMRYYNYTLFGTSFFLGIAALSSKYIFRLRKNTKRNSHWSKPFRCLSHNLEDAWLLRKNPQKAIQRSVRVLEAILRFYFSIFRVFAERFLAMPITIVGKGILSCQSQLTEHQSDALSVNLCTTARQTFCFISDAGRKEVTFSLRSKSTEFSQKR